MQESSTLAVCGVDGWEAFVAVSEASRLPKRHVGAATIVSSHAGALVQQNSCCCASVDYSSCGQVQHVAAT